MASQMRTSAVPFMCGPGAVAVALQGPPLEIWWSSWDHSADCFIPWRILPLPALSGEIKFLAAAFVANDENGLFQPYLVIQQGLSIVVGLLDFDQESCNIIAEISLHGFHPKRTKYVSDPFSIIEDCWLLDGPTVVATCRGRMLLACSQSVTSYNAWRAQVVVPLDRDKWKTGKLMYCGNVNSEAIFLHVPPASDQSEDDGSCFSVALDSLSNAAVHPTSPSDTAPFSGWMPGLPNSVIKGCTLVRSADLKPSSVTCLTTVPYPEADSSREDNFDIVFGTVDRRLIRYRDRKLLASLQFDNVLCRVCFAVVGGGQGIFLVVHTGESQEVTAVCAETNKKLKSWKGISGVIISDVCMLGHDQIVLFPNSEYWNSTSSEDDVDSIVISDLVTTILLGSRNALSLSEERSTQDLPTFVTDSLLSSLSSRVEAGILELNDANTERSRKLELLCSSCSLVEGMKVRCTQLDATIDQESTTVAVQLVRADAVTQKVFGSTWFLLTDIEGQIPGGTELQDLSLVLTTQHGHVMGESSVLGSLGQGASGQLVAHAPLMDVCGLLSPSLNILLAAVVCTGTCEVATVRPESTGNVSLEDSEQELFMPSLHLPKMPVNDGQSGANTSQNRVYKIYTQWLCKVDVAFGTLSECLDSKWCLGIRQVVKYQQLVVSSTDEEHLSLLPSIVKSCLSMVDSTETHDSRIHKFVMPPGLPRAELTAACFSTIAVIALQSEDSRQLVIMERCLRRSLKKRKFKILPRGCAPDMLVHVSACASKLFEELTSYVARQQVKIGSKRKQGSSRARASSSSLQSATDRLCPDLLLFTTTSTELEF